MTLTFIINLIRGVMNNNAPLTLIILSGIVLVYTIVVSGLRQEWVRYAFLVLIGFALYFASTGMTNKINSEFFSSLSTELFGAAIALVLLGKWLPPSLWSLVILAPVVIISEVLIYQIKNLEMQSYYLGISSNIWGAFLVAILLEELVHKREDGNDDDETITQQEKMDRKNRAINKVVHKLQKKVTEDSLRQRELHIERMQKALESMNPTGWDVEITIHGRNRKHLQTQLLHIQQMVHVVHTSDIYKHPSGEHWHCYIKASTVKPPAHTNGTSRAWAALSETALQEEAQAINNGKISPTPAPSPANNDHQDI